MEAQSHLPKVLEPLAFEDGLAYLVKTDILREIMYFSYEKNSLTDIYPLDAAEVKEILRMNRNGQKPESLKLEPEPELPEFVTAVGDDSITRFDAPKKSRRRKQPAKAPAKAQNNGGNGQNNGQNNGGNGQNNGKGRHQRRPDKGNRK